jgi:HEAT repeat protein
VTASAAEVDDLVKLLSDQLGDESAEVRASAAEQLGDLGVDAKSATEALTKAVTDPDHDVRREAIEALRKIKPDKEVLFPLLVNLLSDVEPSVAVAAAASLADVGEEIVPLMNQALGNEKSRFWAILVLSDLGPQAKDAVPSLLKALDSDKPEVRREVLMCLGEIGPGAKDAIPQLTQALEDEDKAVVFAASYALAKIGVEAKSASRAISQGLRSEDEFLQIVSAWALIKVNADNETAIEKGLPWLLQGLQNRENKAVRIAAARAIVDLKPPHEILIPKISKIMEEGTPETRAELIEAVAAVGAEAVPGLSRALKYEDIRPMAAQALGQIGPDAAEAVPALTQYLAESNTETQREILFALGQIGAASKSAVPEVLKQLENEDEDVRYSAVFALGNIGQEASDAVPELIKNIKSDDEFYRLVSAWALVKISPKNEELAKLGLPLLILALKHDRAFVRIEAINTLGELGEAASPAVPALKEALEDPDEDVRRLAAEALKKISAEPGLPGKPPVKLPFGKP